MSNGNIIEALVGAMTGTDENYPQTVNEIIDDEMEYPEGVVEAVENWKKKKLWGSSTNLERLIGLAEMAVELSLIYNIECPLVKVDQSIDLDATVRDTKLQKSGSSNYNLTTHMITMSGNLSIITFLHEYGHALQKGERSATAWSVNLFKRVFPNQFEKLDHSQHTLIRRRTDKDAVNRVLGGVLNESL